MNSAINMITLCGSVQMPQPKPRGLEFESSQDSNQ